MLFKVKSRNIDLHGRYTTILVSEDGELKLTGSQQYPEEEYTVSLVPIITAKRIGKPKGLRERIKKGLTFGL